jgi:poly(A) polymerase
VVLADWWQEFSTGDDNLRQDLMDQAREELARQRAKAPRSVRSQSDSEAAPPREASQDAGAEDSGAPKKRRRRRRSGAKKSGDGGADSGG